MNYSIHFSPTGGTKRVADIFTQSFGGEWVSIDLCDRHQDFSQYAFTAEDLCLISAPAYGGRAPAAAIARLGQMHGNNTPVILNAVFGNRAIDDTLLELKETLSPLGFRCIGAMETVAEHSIVRQVATGRPNVDDRVQLADFAARLREKLAAGEDAEVEVPGNRPYRAFGGTPLKPVGNDLCTSCGLCAQECPVGAIPEDDLPGVDKALCISCLRCVRICPQNCRSVNPRPMAVTCAKLKAGCSEPKENKLYI